MTKNGFSSEYSSEGYRKTSQERAAYWGIALGLQAVDGLKPSDYLLELVEKSINDELDYRDVTKQLTDYYSTRDASPDQSRQREADLAAARINELYQVPGFDLSVECLVEYHRYIFQDTMSDAGEFKKDALWKQEEILFGDTVNYINPQAVKRLLERAIEDERWKTWDSSEKAYVIDRISNLTKQIWFVHPFNEGNTRAVAVFIGKYLDFLGFDISNDSFKEHSLYYRNALVRACYANIAKGIRATSEYLDRFYENLLYEGENQLSNRDLFVLELASDEQRKAFTGTVR